MPTGLCYVARIAGRGRRAGYPSRMAGPPSVHPARGSVFRGEPPAGAVPVDGGAPGRLPADPAQAALPVVFRRAEPLYMPIREGVAGAPVVPSAGVQVVRAGGVVGAAVKGVVATVDGAGR